MNLKEVVGKEAVNYVKDGMIVGLGTGSTVFYFVHALAEKVKEGFDLLCDKNSGAIKVILNP